MNSLAQRRERKTIIVPVLTDAEVLASLPAPKPVEIDMHPEVQAARALDSHSSVCRCWFCRS